MGDYIATEAQLLERVDGSHPNHERMMNIPGAKHWALIFSMSVCLAELCLSYLYPVQSEWGISHSLMFCMYDL